MSRPNASERAAHLLRNLDQSRLVNVPGMIHAPHCQRLVIVMTKGYTVTVNRCDECGAITTERH